MYSTEVKRLRKGLRKDSRFKKVVKFFSTLAEEISVVGFQDEIRRLHKTRAMRSLDRSSKAFLDKIVEANLQDQAYRSRLAEIQLDCTRTLAQYEPIIEDLVSYLYVEYLDTIKPFFTAKQDRMEFLNSLCKEQVTFLREIRSVLEGCRIVIEDIDKAGYMFKNLIEATKIVHERKT